MDASSVLEQSQVNIRFVTRDRREFFMPDPGHDVEIVPEYPENSAVCVEKDEDLFTNIDWGTFSIRHRTFLRHKFSRLDRVTGNNYVWCEYYENDYVEEKPLKEARGTVPVTAGGIPKTKLPRVKRKKKCKVPCLDWP